MVIKNSIVSIKIPSQLPGTIKGVSIILKLIITIVATLKKSLSFTGAIAAFILGFTLFLSGGLRFIIALMIAYFISTIFQSMPGGTIIRNGLFIFIAGIFGFLLDSVLGAALQPVYIDSETGLLTEKESQNHKKNPKVKGLAFFNNDIVNFISTGLAACLIIIFLGFLGQK